MKLCYLLLAACLAVTAVAHPLAQATSGEAIVFFPEDEEDSRTVETPRPQPSPKKSEPIVEEKDAEEEMPEETKEEEQEVNQPKFS